MTRAESDLQAAVSAILEGERSEYSELQTYPDPQIGALSRKHGEKLQPIYTAAGLDINKIRELQREYRDSFQQLLEKSKPKADEAFALRLRERTSNKKRSMELVGGKPLTITQLVVDKPAFIFTTPSGMWVDEHIESWNNWAKVFLTVENVSGTASLKFFFGWRNPSPEFAAVINAKGEIVAQGSYKLDAFAGILDGGVATLYIDSTLSVFNSANFVDQDRDFLMGTRSIGAHGGLFGADDKHEEGTINAINNLECNNIIVEADEQVIFEVAMRIQYTMSEDAKINVDFSGDFQVTSAALIVELLTAPTVTANLDAVSPLIKS
jgi:hypothetical protein